MGIQYAFAIRVAETAATAASATTAIWAVYNTGKRLVTLARLVVGYHFAGTVATTSARYDIVRFVTTTTPTGGTAITPSGITTRALSGDFAVSLGDARFLDTNLTFGGAPTFDAPAAHVGGARQYATTQQLVFCEPMQIAPGEGLCIQRGIVAVIGDTLTGTAIFEQAGVAM